MKHKDGVSVVMGTSMGIEHVKFVKYKVWGYSYIYIYTHAHTRIIMLLSSSNIEVAPLYLVVLNF